MQGKAVAHLARLKLYPQTRAVPRQALKEYLLRALLKHDVVQFGHRLAKMEVNPAGGKDRSEVVCSFENGKEIRADVSSIGSCPSDCKTSQRPEMLTCLACLRVTRIPAAWFVSTS